MSDFERSYSRDELAELPFFPLDAPGMPMPGPDFVAQAEGLGDPPLQTVGRGKQARLSSWGPYLESLYREATYQPNFRLGVAVKGRIVESYAVPGHVWCDGGQPGPRPSRVMVIGKWPGHEEVVTGFNFQGPSGELLARALAESGCSEAEYGSYYVTNVVKHTNLDPSSNRLPSTWVANWAPVLQQELRIARPDYVLCLGAEASAAVLGKAVGGIAASQGRVFDVPVVLNRTGDEEPAVHVAKAMTCLHPAAVARAIDQYPDLLAGVRQFVRLTRGEAVGGGRHLDVELVYTERHLRQVVEDVLADPDGNCVALDSEWHGDYPTEPGAWLRTVQFSHRPGKAYVVVLRHAGGAAAFCPSIDRVSPLLRRVLVSTPERPVRLIGHNLRADLPWIRDGLDVALGDDLIRQFTAPEDDPDPDGVTRLFGYQKTRTEGGFDTMLGVHSVQEVAGPFGYKLEVVCNQYCGIPRWDLDLAKWRSGIKAKDLEGYGECPDDVLLGGNGHPPYAAWDAAGTRELFEVLNRPGGLLDRDRFGNDCRRPFWIAMRASPAFLEMERTGMAFDRARAEELTGLYMDTVEAMIAELRREIAWPNFNPRSTPQCVELLFGARYNHKRDAEGNPVVLAEPGAFHLNFKPVVATGKRPKQWDQIRRQGEEHLYTPATGKEVLGILLANMPVRTPTEEKCKRVVTLLRNIRFIGAILARTLCPPDEVDDPDDADAGEFVYDEAGHLVFSKGMVSFVHADGRLRTHLFQTKETGRASSARPPMQNFAKRRECYSADTEFLTSRGWVFGPDLREDDLVAQYWAGSKKIEFVRPTRLVSYRYAGPMVHLHNDVCDLLVTPEHRCLVERRNTGRLVEFAAAELPLTGLQFVAGFCEEGAMTLSQDEAVLLAAVQADAHWNRDHLEFCFRKDCKYDRLTQSLDRLGVVWTRSRSNRGDRRVQVSGRLNPATVAWLADLLEGGKVFSAALLQRLDGPAKRLLAEEVFFWNGSTRCGNSYYGSTIPANLDFVQALFTTVGWRSVLNKAAGKVYCKATRSDKVDLMSVRRDRVAYAGEVYCVTVPSSWVVVRRNGRPAVSGNSDYKKILGDAYKAPLRSMLKSTPGWVLVESDYIGAELFMAALQSGSKAMVDHCLRAELDDRDPNKYDIHSTVTVQAFRLTIPDEKTLQKGAEVLGRPVEDLGLKVGDPLPPLKFWLKAAGSDKLRDVAKCVVAGSRLLTSRGWVRVEDLCGHLPEDSQVPYDGDLALMTDEGPTPLTGLYCGPVQPCLRVATEDGHVVTGTHEHRFRSVDADGRLVWVRAADLRVGDWVVAYDGSGDVPEAWQGDWLPPLENWPAADEFRDNVGPVPMPAFVTSDLAAFLGLYVSEGRILPNPAGRTVTVSLAEEEDDEFAAESERLLRRLFGPCLRVESKTQPPYQRRRYFYVSSNQLAEWVRRICPGSFGQKVVPEFVFRWPPRLVRVFLRWLFEGDGTAKQNGRGFTIAYSSGGEALARGVQLLLDGLGVANDLSSERRRGSDGRYWVVSVRRSAQARFIRDVGFVTRRKTAGCSSAVAHAADRDDVYPNQEAQLSAVFPFLAGRPLEKCRECLRDVGAARLDRTRLRLILDGLPAGLPPGAASAADHLRNLAGLRGRFVRVTEVSSAGRQKVYDVESGNHHLVVDGLSNHNTLLFGMLYGRGDEAIVRAIEEEGIQVTLEQAGAIRKTIFRLYPELEIFMEGCQGRVLNPGYMTNCFGRYRRFQQTNDRKVLGELQRQAMNYNIQSGIADLVSRALDLLYYWPDRCDEAGPRYRMVLQIHDAVLFEVRPDSLAWFLGDREHPGVLQRCMSGVPVWACDLDGRPLKGRDPYYLPAEYGLFSHWGVSLSRDEGLAIGVPEAYLPKVKK